jgi:hypothetical protein
VCAPSEIVSRASGAPVRIEEMGGVGRANSGGCCFHFGHSATISFRNMDRKAKSNAKSIFLESIPSQLRYAYLALKKKQDAKAVDARNRDNDLKDVISGHNFAYLPFDKLCKNEFEPEDCHLRFDAVSCKLIMRMLLSEVN